MSGKQMNLETLFTLWVKAIIFRNLSLFAFIRVYLRFNC